MDWVSTPARTKLPLVLWIGSAIFIVYGTTIPFRFISDRTVVLHHLARVVWNPFVSPDTRHRVPIPDFVGNVLLFAPFGCLGMWALRRPRVAFVKAALIVATGALLSIAVEAAQLFTVDRISSVADVFANTLGAAAGATAGILLGASAEAFVANAAAAGLADVTAFYPLVIATLVMLAGAWEPFDVTLDVGSLMPKLRLFLRDPVQFGVLSDEALALLQHILFASALVVWLKQARVRSSLRIAAAIGIVVALGAESVQLFVAARMPGVWDAVVGVVGVLAGLAAGIDFWRSRRAPTPGRWCVGLVTLTAIGVAMQQLSPFQLAHGGFRRFQWIPFLNYYEFTTSQTVSHAAELLLAYIPMGFGLGVALRTPGARFATVTGVALAIAVPVEWLQRFVGDRYPDITDIGLSIAGAWLGLWIGTRGWLLFDEQIALVTRRRRVAHAPSVR